MKEWLDKASHLGKAHGVARVQYCRDNGLVMSRPDAWEEVLDNELEWLAAGVLPDYIFDSARSECGDPPDDLAVPCVHAFLVGCHRAIQAELLKGGQPVAIAHYSPQERSGTGS